MCFLFVLDFYFFFLSRNKNEILFFDTDGNVYIIPLKTQKKNGPSKIAFLGNATRIKKKSRDILYLPKNSIPSKEKTTTNNTNTIPKHNHTKK